MAKKQRVSVSDLLEALTEDLTIEDTLSAKVLAEISTQIASMRIERGMSQKEFADFVGTTQADVSKWESSYRNFSVKKLVEIACKLDCDLSVTFEKLSEAHKAHNNVIQLNDYRAVRSTSPIWIYSPEPETELKEN